MIHKQRKRLCERGFTLVEIMVVIVILGLLATLVVPNVLSSAAEAEVGVATTNVRSIHETATYWTMKKHKIPTMEELVEPDEKGDVALAVEPEDPWGNPYEIRELDGRRRFEVLSWGPDMQEGNEDDIVYPPRRDG